MHTFISLPPDSSSPINGFLHLSYRFRLGVALAIIVLLTVTVASGTVAARGTAPPTPGRSAQAPADSIWLNARAYPLALWGPRAGFGGGAGLVIHNPVGTGTQGLVTVAPARRDQSATLTLSTTGNPGDMRRYAVLDARVRHTDREWFYGLGAGTSDESRASVELWSWNVRLRSGLRFWDRRVLAQPHVRLTQYRYRGLQRLRGPSTPAIATHLDALTGSGGTLADPLTGVVVGADLALDTRDRQEAPIRGWLVRASADRFTGLTSSDPTRDRFEGEIATWIPLGGRHRLALSASAQVTRRRSGNPVPFFLRSTLDGRQLPGYDRSRFADNDRLTGALRYEFPLYEFGNLFVVEGHAGVHAGSVYRNVFDQFEASVSFDENLSFESSTPPSVPLRPAVSTGIRAGPLFRDQAFVQLALGVSPEGVSGVRVTFVQPLTPLRQPHHQDWF